MILFRQLSFLIISFIIFGCEEQSTQLNNPVEELNLTSCEEIKTENLKIAKFDELLRKAEAGDKRLMYMLYVKLISENISRPYNYWERKMAEAGDISSRYMLINIADEKDKAQLIKQWHFEDYIEYEKDIGNSKSYPYLDSPNKLSKIKIKAQKGDLVAMYILQEYYNIGNKNPKQYIFWLKKLANSGDISAQHSLIFDAPTWERWKLAKKYHLELDYFMSFHYELLNKGIVEYRDDDPKGVFFDENGSVINFE